MGRKNQTIPKGGKDYMKKLMTAMMVCALAAVMVLGGCSGAKKGEKGKDGKAAAEKPAPQPNPFASLEKDICDPDKTVSLLVDGPFMKFMGKIMFKAMSATMPKEQMEAAGMTEEKMIESMKQSMPDETNKPAFDSCTAKVEAKDCAAAYKMIADSITADPTMKQMFGDDPGKTIEETAKEFKIKNCGVLAVKSQEKGKGEEAADFVVGEIDGKSQIFFIVNK